MNEKVFGEWLSALKSGRYVQSQCYLVSIVGRVTRYCCLGVLSYVTNTVNERDHLVYPTSLLHSGDEDVLVSLNDKGDYDNYQRVICELESAPELYITEG